MNIGPLYIVIGIVCIFFAISFIIAGFISKIKDSEKFYLLTMGFFMVIVGISFFFHEYISPLATSIGFFIIVLIAFTRKKLSEVSNDEET